MADFKLMLPECGILVGNAIYNCCAGYLNGSGIAYTTWQADSTSPCELIELTVKENQGNLVQLWWGDGGVSPITKGRYYALEDIDVSVPEPDWEHGVNLDVRRMPEFQQYKSRAGAGMLKSLRCAAEHGLYSTLLYGSANGEYSQAFSTVKNYIGYDFGERFTFRLDERYGANGEFVSLSELADNFCREVAAFVEQRRASGWGPIICTSSNFYMDYEVVSGVDYTMYEDCCFELNFMSALSRGLHKQHQTVTWGAHIANEHYSWLSFANPHRYETLRNELFLKYMAGAKILISESGAWHVQTTADDSPMNDTPRINTVIGLSDPALAQPLYKEAKKHFPLLDRNSGYCKKYRQVISDFYDYVKANGTPAGQPEVNLAVVKGNYDLSTLMLDGSHPNNVIGGLYAQAERNPNWFDSAPERSWELVRRVFFPRPQGIYGSRDYNRLFSGTPYGQIDIVSLAQDKIEAEFFKKEYKVLLMGGWNTCSAKQYEIFCEYVKNGGKLFISIPHFSTDVTRNIWQYTENDLVNGGDLSELCGVKVLGRGERFYWVTAPTREPNCLGVTISRRYGVYCTSMGRLAITDPAMETLLLDHETLNPILLRRQYGKGEVYFLNSWAYPGAYDYDYGPGAEPGSCGMIGDIFRYLAQAARGEVFISGMNSPLPDRECEYISYSYFKESGKICLMNIDFESSHQIMLHYGAKSWALTLGKSEFKVIDVKKTL
ncbi:MAG: hypothetical protein MST10_01815 [Lentisphaeria bacterium]|nr:hypothetical protein [Lentisphaeria bacterium]